MTELLHQLEAPGDAELISRVREGDLEAYGDLYARHVDAARRLARQLVRGPDSDDLVSDAFAKVMAVLRRGGGPDVAFRAYLLTAVRRLHVDRIRATSRLTTTDDLEAFDPGVPFQDTAVAQFENGAAARAFASLPERWQLVLWHLEVEGQKPAEIAVLLGMSPNSVSALAYRAREGLRQAYLAAHLTTTDQAECRWVTERLGGYVRKGLSKRDHDKVALHLDVCPRCTAMYLELTEVNDNLAGVIAPLLLGGLAAGYLGSGGAGAAGGVVALLGRAKDTVTGNVGPVVAGTTAATVAVATLVASAVTGDDDPPTAAGGGDRSSTGTDDRGADRGADRDDASGQGATGPARLPAPRTAGEPGLPMSAPLLGEPVTLLDAAVPTTVTELVAAAAPTSGTDPDPATDPGAGPGTGPGTDPGAGPGDPETDIRVAGATVSDDSLVVDVDNLPPEPVTIVVDLASDSGRAAFVPGQRVCSVDAASPTRAVCVTSTAMARMAATQLAPRSFQAVIPLDFPADVDVDVLDVSVSVIGYRETFADDNRIRFEYRPVRTPTDGPTSGGPTDGPTTGGPTDGPTTGGPTDGPTTGGPTDGPTTGGPTEEPTEEPTDGPDLAVALSHVSDDDGRFKVQVSTPRGTGPADVPLRLSFRPGTVTVTERDCAGPADGVVTCDWNGNTWVGFFSVPVGPGDAVEVSTTVSLPGLTDPRPENNTDTLRLQGGDRATGDGGGPEAGGGGPKDTRPAEPGGAKPSEGPGRPDPSPAPDKPARPAGPQKPAKPENPAPPGKADPPGRDAPPGKADPPGKPDGPRSDSSRDSSGDSPGDSSGDRPGGKPGPEDKPGAEPSRPAGEGKGARRSGRRSPRDG